MKKLKTRLKSILARYIFLVLIAIPNLWLFYLVFTPLTVYPVFFLLKIFYENVILLNRNLLIINREVPIEIVKACVAGSAYYLLLILNLSLPNVKLKQRIRMIFFSFSILLIVNIIRIVFLAMIFLDGFSWFVLTHKVFWYVLSTLFVVGIWFAQVKYFNIKEIPFYSDIKFLYKKSLLGK